MVDLLLLEAEEINADQILLISREERTNLYFVAKNRVRKSLQLRVDCTPDLLDHLAQTQNPSSSNADEPNGVQVTFTRNRAGHCISLTIQKASTAPAVNIDHTIPIPALF